MSQINSVDFSNKLQSTSEVKKPTKITSRDIRRSEFKEKFEKIKSDEVREKLQGIFDKIVDKSESLRDHLYLKDVIEYKKLVRDFLDVAVNNSHKFSQENFLDRRGRHRVYSIIKKVDVELDSITREFLKTEVDHMSVLKKIDGIRGMLLDIMM